MLPGVKKETDPFPRTPVVVELSLGIWGVVRWVKTPQVDGQKGFVLHRFGLSNSPHNIFSVPTPIAYCLLHLSLRITSTSTADTTDSTFQRDIERTSLEDVQKIPSLSFLVFTKLAYKNFGQDGRMKGTVNNRYLELATEASKSDDEKTAEDGKKMLGLFETELEQVEAFWSQAQLVRCSLFSF